MTISIEKHLGSVVRGDVRFDRLTRTIYATDASIYEIIPQGVVLPRDRDDIVNVVHACREYGVSIVPRGAGTGLTGGAVGAGLQVDCSRYMNRISDLDVDACTVRVEPGVVLDQLNAHLAPHGLHFAPDVATSSRATLGGMIANNSCGARSVLHGRTVDHVRELTVVLADGSVATWPGSQRFDHVTVELKRIAKTYHQEVRARFPKVLRRNGGYALDRICDAGDDINPIDIICGSEGTLCVVVEAVLDLTPLPNHQGLLLVHFGELLDALDATQHILEHQPAAVELLDANILDAAKRDSVVSDCLGFLDETARAVLIVEFLGDHAEQVQARLQRLTDFLTERRIGYAYRAMTDAAEQHDVWEMRKRGLGLLMSRPGDRQTCAFVEDTAVEPARLRDYIERFQHILREEGVSDASYYAHASVGVIHVRPALNLKTANDVRRLHRVADRVSSLALEFGGANTGEHGDGLVRSCWIEKMYGPVIVEAFKEVKRAFDPENLFNPGKIVDAPPMTDNLRFGPDYDVRQMKTHFDYTPHGGPAGLVEMCSGLGQCRQRFVGTMCPSFAATGDETHTTRARANALRSALSNRGLLEGLGDSALDEVMDLCLSCKACKTECPTGVDMARLKAEWLAHRNARRGVSRQARFIADAPKLAAMGSRFPRVSNLILQTSFARAVMERRYGLDRRIAPPRLARTTFRDWFTHHVRQRQRRKSTPRVVYFVDTWTNYYTPSVGIAAVKLLEAAGFHVLAPRLECCGRTLISKGLLTEAKRRAKENIAELARFADTNTPILGTEPSCILTLVDEYPQLVQTEDARAVARVTKTLDSFLLSLVRNDPSRLVYKTTARRLLYHAHCHQKALIGSSDALALLNTPPGFVAEEINSGCCGMAGSFGHEMEHYDIAAAIGEERLFPAIRQRGDSRIAVSGFSCRQQIQHHTGVAALHTVEHLADVLENTGS